MYQQTILDILDNYPYDIREINLSGMGLYSIPSLERFSMLVRLNISNNNLTILPELPPSLMHLNCSENNITEIFILPDGLLSLNCNNNLLVKIHMVPHTLETLECKYNHLRTLPNLKNIKQLFCDHNELWHIPKPNVLEYISCKNNSENVSEYNERTLVMERVNQKILDVEGIIVRDNTITY
uniref:Leucine-rich repeat protein n=1 Tax=viral metagenome TaxID=1070528 RepID=A0A6C0JX15_9ZZZZ